MMGCLREDGAADPGLTRRLLQHRDDPFVARGPGTCEGGSRGQIAGQRGIGSFFKQHPDHVLVALAGVRSRPA